MLRKWTYSLLFGTAILISLWLFFPRLSLYWTLYQLKHAVEQQNPDLFFSYANADSIANSFLESSSQFLNSNSDENSQLSQFLYQLFEKPAHDALKNYLNKCIQKGQISTPTSLMLLPYYYLFYDSNLVYHSHSIQGGWKHTAIVTIYLKDKTQETDSLYSVHLRFIRGSNGKWIWIGFQDLEIFFEQMLRRKSLEEKPQA